MTMTYTEGLKEFNRKYDANIKGISRAQGVDLGVASLMLICNGILLVENSPYLEEEWKAGSGAIDVDQFKKDVVALEALKVNKQK